MEKLKKKEENDQEGVRGRYYWRWFMKMLSFNLEKLYLYKASIEQKNS